MKKNIKNNDKILNKIISLIFIFLVSIGVIALFIGLYKNYFQSVDIIQVSQNELSRAIYDEAKILDKQTQQEILSLNQEFSKKNIHFTILTIPSLKGALINRYATLFMENLKNQTPQMSHILIILAIQEKQIFIHPSESLQAILGSTEVFALIDKEHHFIEQSLYQKAILTALEGAAYEVANFYQIESLKNNLQQSAITTIEREVATEHNSIIEALLKVLIILAIAILFIRFDSRKEIE
ncbi:hypothetical protein CCZ01_07275 [Helicobacter monodelphidis]|uniref:TPM domain-containing protein n=1 Tax=Helicobacter sp. 15-1451 TaxID=2004995 RepID=UPI000DCE7732|nr:TPM domain-containing protein [Helicobacter sp. 15-1451]RAX57137.1 hypothetical protein CCZ01_07275 [Helicobacter sp. 15-1451]